MDRDKTEQVPQPTDPPVDEIVGIDGDASGEADTEGHNMLTVDLAWTIARERVREGEKMSRDAARVREARASRDGSSREGGFLKRFGRR
jgi:hypothetical protein